MGRNSFFIYYIHLQFYTSSWKLHVIVLTTALSTALLLETIKRVNGDVNIGDRSFALRRAYKDDEGFQSAICCLFSRKNALNTLASH